MKRAAVIAGCLALAMASAFGQGSTPIRNLKLTTDADAGGHSITNLGQSFYDDLARRFSTGSLPLAVHTNRTDNPHGVTAAQIGALTAEADPVAGPRLDLIEPETNKWNAAYGWGDHALAGYLLPADLSPYATTQQVAEAVSGAVTNLNLYAVPVGGGKHSLWIREETP